MKRTYQSGKCTMNNNYPNLFTIPAGTVYTRQEGDKTVVYRSTEPFIIKITNSEAETLEHSFNYKCRDANVP